METDRQPPRPPQPQPPPRSPLRPRNPLLWVAIALLGFWLFQTFVLGPAVTRRERVTYDVFRRDVAAGRVSDVKLGDRLIEFQLVPDSAGAEPVTRNTVPVEDPDLVSLLLADSVTVSREPSGGTGSTILFLLILFVPLLFFWFFMRMLGQRGGGRSMLSFGKSKAREISGTLTGITFENVGGIDEVETELIEIIDFLKQPDRFTRIGAKLPKGVLLVGPPGTGKTLVAKAVAGEAGVPFFSISGSDFVEMFVGVGAARVRDLFEQAKTRAPCIIFIDEIDAIGRARTGINNLQTNDEREQTLNQLLAEMDGFDTEQGVVMIAATNRPEILDRALLRAGRFDRQIQIPLPSERGRFEILRIHTAGVDLAREEDLKRVAQMTPGFSGADLANIVNEAALMAVRASRETVTLADFELALERVIAGLQRKEPLAGEVRRRVAFHEGGHALVASLLPHTEPVHKVSIIPTGRGALGYTMQMPDQDRYLTSEAELHDRLTVMLGGRAAELVICGEPSTGAANDLERATELARRMVAEFGMSPRLGPVRYTASSGYGFLGMETGLRQDLGPDTAARVDEEMRRIVEAAQNRAIALLRENEAALREVARTLQEHEVVSGAEIKRIARVLQVTAPITTDTDEGGTES
ncbi:MAG: ATP-dependent zinc metalloprotease FtsH [Gemmatimonadota bacterium]|jgi:cell division protease FtsH